MDFFISYKELVDRPIIRDDQQFEFMNKMTDIEIEQLNDKVWLKEGLSQEFPYRQASFISKIIDIDVLYKSHEV